MMSSAKRAALFGVILLAALELWFFVYNSGYGYDALEYLVIGRSLNDGYPLYHFVPSKSWALYVLVAVYLKLPFAGTHVGISLLVTLTLLATCFAAYVVTRRRFGREAAAVSALLLCLAGIFMELNYVEPEPFVFLSGLTAFAALTRPGQRSRWWPWLVAGVSIGVGMAFKAVAGFYAVAVVLWAVLAMSRQGEGLARRRLSQLGVLVSGVLLAIAAPAAFFWFTGRLQPHLEWSYVFPLLHYPARFEWAGGRLVKLAWVWLLIGAAFAMSSARERRQPILQEDALSLMLMLGLVGLVPLWKTQASHYAFPGAAFLLMFSAVVFSRSRAWQAASFSRVGLSVGAAVLAATIASGAAYRPEAIDRFVTLNSFRYEDTIRSSIDGLVGPHERAVFLSGATRFYWLADRYPFWELVNTEVQTTHLVRTRGAELAKTFDDLALKVVEFDPEYPRFNDSHFLESPEARQFMSTVMCRLQTAFDRRDDVLARTVFWVRKPAHAMTGGTAGCAG